MSPFQDKSIPLYYQIENLLRGQIRSGDYKPGQALPTEDQLTKSYGVSRITIRRALSVLEQDGLILKKTGRGSYVSNKIEMLEAMKLTGTIDDIIGMGIKTKVKTLGLDIIVSTPHVAEKLAVEPGTPVCRIERLRSIVRQPFSYTLTYIPSDLAIKISKKELQEFPLLNLLEAKYNLKITHGSQTIDATLADSRIASLLQVSTCAPLLRIKRVVYDVMKRPIEYITILYRSDLYNYSVELVRRESQSHSKWDHSPDTSPKR
jgi:GntR family transcriptional regulator